MREIRSNAMQRSKYARKNHSIGNHKYHKYSHHYERGNNPDSRLLYMAMNRIEDISPDAKATFQGFVNSVAIVMAIWFVIGSYMYFYS